jgi:hypothetical protein
MKNLYYWFVSFGLFCLSNITFGQNSLTIINPQAQWQQRKGTIEEATFSIRPKGLYMECGLYLTFSARSWDNFFYHDSLEAVLKFSLPEGAIIHDSWLWINDDIARGKILDRWTASQVYEGIVKRKQDPSILTKESATNYTLRVYPLLKGKTRRVKITYLQPVNWSKREVSLPVPGYILSSSNFDINNFNVLVFPEGDDLKNLSFTNLANTNFQEINDPAAGGKFWRAVLTRSQYSQNLQISFDAPMRNGLFVSMMGDSTEGVYQLALLPAALLEEQKPVKLALVFDHELQSDDLTMPQLLARVRNHLKATLNQTDSFNLFFSNLIVQPHKPKWIPADDASIDQIFNALSNLPSYSQLPNLLGSAIQFIKNHGGSGQIMVLSNSAQFANLTSANNLLDDLKNAIAPELIPIHIVDFRTSNSPSFYVGGLYYSANTYLYVNLAKQTGGSFSSIRELQYDVEKTFNTGFSAVGSQIQNLEITTGLANGYCFGRFTPNGTTQISAPTNRPILQLGKFKGQPPFKVTISGELNGDFFYKTQNVTLADIRPADSLSREMWYGNFIQLLEKEVATNSNISQIIYNSISERVLSKYTAFLCIEDTTTYCDKCLDEQKFSAIDDILTDSLVKITPNPFSDFVKIELSGATAAAGATSMEVFDLSGKLVKVLETAQEGDAVSATWHGTDSQGDVVTAGVYLVLIKNRLMNRMARLIKL